MSYLVDANVISETMKRIPNSKVVHWLRGHENQLFVDPIIIGELQIGILTMAPGKKRNRLEKWFGEVVQKIECLPWDVAVSQRWAKLIADLRKKGNCLPTLDSMIAATALEHELTLVTHNIKDFQATGVMLFDPIV